MCVCIVYKLFQWPLVSVSVLFQVGLRDVGIDNVQVIPHTVLFGDQRTVSAYDAVGLADFVNELPPLPAAKPSGGARSSAGAWDTRAKLIAENPWLIHHLPDLASPCESLRPLQPRTELNKSSSVFKIMRRGTVVELEKLRREIFRLSCGGEKVNVPVLGM